MVCDGVLLYQFFILFEVCFGLFWGWFYLGKPFWGLVG
jgi:hypothetical protein